VDGDLLLAAPGREEVVEPFLADAPHLEVEPPPGRQERVVAAQVDELVNLVLVLVPELALVDARDRQGVFVDKVLNLAVLIPVAVGAVCVVVVVPVALGGLAVGEFFLVRRIGISHGVISLALIAALDLSLVFVVIVVGSFDAFPGAGLGAVFRALFLFIIFDKELSTG